MTTVRDELVDVIAVVMHDEVDECHHGPVVIECERAAGRIFAALVERYGEPEIEELPDAYDGNRWLAMRRLVFPWQAVKEGKNNATE